MIIKAKYKGMKRKFRVLEFGEKIEKGDLQYLPNYLIEDVDSLRGKLGDKNTAQHVINSAQETLCHGDTTNLHPGRIYFRDVSKY